MFPLFDSTPRRSFPYVNYLMIAINILVFWFTLTAPNTDDFISKYAFTASHFHFTDIMAFIPLITALFVHGSIFHILSNMWFLHIFGDNVEDHFGHVRYIFFYLIGGLIANLSQYIVDPSSTIPMVGASGAISAVAGAYFVLYKRSTVKSLVFLFIIITVVDIPAWLFLGYWFFIQLFSGFGSLTTMAVQDGGVAFFAHVGGFIFGYIMAKFFWTAPASESEVEVGRIFS